MKQVWKTSDGREFDSEEEADRHERLVKAADYYMDALLRYGQALAETQRTADGHPLELSRTHYRVHPRHCEVESVHVLGGMSVEVRDDGEVFFYLPDWDHVTRFFPSSLYRDHKAAKEAAVDQLRARINDLGKRAKRLEES